MLPHTPQDALTAAGAETPIAQPLPRTPTEATPFLDLSRPPPRAKVNPKTSIPRTPVVPGVATGIAASSLEASGGR
eukprot:4780827-Prorocentrum_lima.AAC.1